MANDLVVQLGAKLDRFQSDMNQAGDIADAGVSKIESSFSKLNPSVASNFIPTLLKGVGSVVAVAFAAYSALKELNSEMAELGKNAEAVGLSVERFQELKFAATQTGQESGKFVTDLKAMNALLADARDNENSLTKILTTNGLKYKDQNGEVIKTNEAIKVATTLINGFQSFPDKVKAAQMVGLSEDWVRSLRENGKEFQNIASQAEAAGVVVDKATIAKAAAFDREWKAAADSTFTKLKAELYSIGGALDEMIRKGKEFINSIDIPDDSPIAKFFQRLATASTAFRTATNDAIGISNSLDDINKSLALAQAKGNTEAIEALVEMKKKAEEAAAALAEAVKQKAALLAGVSAENFPEGVPLPTGRPAAADKPSPDRFKFPSRAVAADTDSFTKQTEQIQKHIETTKADTIAVFENHAAQEGLRAEFTLLNAIRKDEGEVTQKQIDEYTTLRATMTSQQALTAAGINLTDKHKAAFDRLTTGIQTSTAAADKARDSLAKINSASSQLGSALSTAFADAIVEGKSLNEVFSSLIKTLEKAAINAVFANIFNAPSSGGLSPFASLFPKFASGTNYAPGGWSIVGEQGPELVNLNRGAQVVPNGAASGGAPIVYSPSIDARGASVEAVARLAEVMAAQQKTFARDVVDVVRRARQGRHL